MSAETQTDIHNDAQTVGVIGLGLMGSALSQRFIEAERNVIGFDPREECRQQLRDIGGEPVDSADAVFQAANVVVLSLPNSDIVVEVCAVARRLRAAENSTMQTTRTDRLRIIDTTTGDPVRTTELGQSLWEVGIDYLDATLTGSSQQARAGELVVTAGGRPESFQQSEPLFRDFAKQSFHVGPWGSGAKTKLIVNLVLGLNRAVLAEGLSLAQACGLELNEVLNVLRSGAAYSRAMDTKGRKMIESDFAPEAKLAQHWKDVRLILEMSDRVEATTPLSQLHEGLLSDLVQRGFGDFDNSSVIRAFDRKAE